MTRGVKRQREMLLIEILQAALDLRALAGAVEAPMLVYLADLLAARARKELEAIALPGAAAANSNGG